MKKIAALLATVVILTILLSSCGSSEKCAAYGEYKDYKVENR
jgi:major membrane immunogen (membrane-anchored lipoprotein)